jgi:hypothetical protein
MFSFILKNIISEIRVSMGTAATIMEAFDAVVYFIPEFSKRKYSTIPRKPDKAIKIISFFSGILKDLVKHIAVVSGTSAISCLSVAIVDGGRNPSKTFVLIKDNPHKIMVNSRRDIAV